MNIINSITTCNKVDGPGLDESYLIGEIKNFKNIIKCVICHGFPVKYTTCRYCRCICCKYCIGIWLEENNSCPNCRDFFVESELDRYTGELMNKFKLRCLNYDLGCRDEIFLENYDDHYITQCRYTVYKCEYCEYKGNIDVMIAHYCESQCPYCNQKIHRSKKVEHKEKCKKEVCEYCGKIFAKSKLKIHNDYHCAEMRVECDMCNYTCERKKLEEHRNKYHQIEKITK